MFGDLMGNMEERQKEMKKKLAEIILEAESGDGAVKVRINAAREVLNIAFDQEKLDWNDREEVEDLVLVAINRAIGMAAQKEAEESQKMIQDMLPPGMGGLGDLFG